MKNMTMANMAKACGGVLHEPEEKTAGMDVKEAVCVVRDSFPLFGGGCIQGYSDSGKYGI